MPLYEYQCPACGAIVNEYRAVDFRNDSALCSCGAMADRIMSVPQPPIGMATDFSGENGGRGRFIPQLAEVKDNGNGGQCYDEQDPRAFARSQGDAIEKAKSYGLSAITA